MGLGPNKTIIIKKEQNTKMNTLIIITLIDKILQNEQFNRTTLKHEQVKYERKFKHKHDTKRHH